MVRILSLIVLAAATILAAPTRAAEPALGPHCLENPDACRAGGTAPVVVAAAPGAKAVDVASAPPDRPLTLGNGDLGLSSDEIASKSRVPVRKAPEPAPVAPEPAEAPVDVAAAESQAAETPAVAGEAATSTEPVAVVVTDEPTSEFVDGEADQADGAIADAPVVATATECIERSVREGNGLRESERVCRSVFGD